MTMDKPDYVILGGGTAGLVLANKLSAEAGNKVLVLEAGRPDKNLLVAPWAPQAVPERPRLGLLLPQGPRLPRPGHLPLPREDAGRVQLRERDALPPRGRGGLPGLGGGGRRGVGARRGAALLQEQPERARAGHEGRVPRPGGHAGRGAAAVPEPALPDVPGGGGAAGAGGRPHGGLQRLVAAAGGLWAVPGAAAQGPPLAHGHVLPQAGPEAAEPGDADGRAHHQDPDRGRPRRGRGVRAGQCEEGGAAGGGRRGAAGGRRRGVAAPAAAVGRGRPGGAGGEGRALPGGLARGGQAPAGPPGGQRVLRHRGARGADGRHVHPRRQAREALGDGPVGAAGPRAHDLHRLRPRRLCEDAPGAGAGGPADPVPARARGEPGRHRHADGGGPRGVQGARPGLPAGGLPAEERGQGVSGLGEPLRRAGDPDGLSDGRGGRGHAARGAQWLARQIGGQRPSGMGDRGGVPRRGCGDGRRLRRISRQTPHGR
ncbi:unnamed protein product [Heterosigma akashiwo]